MERLTKINNSIRNIKVTVGNLNTRIQDTAVLCIEHAKETGDANPAMRLVEAIQPRLRQPLVLFFETYSLINIKKAKGGFSCSLSKVQTRTWDMDGAKANPWYESAAAKKDDLPIDLMDLDKKIVSLVNFAEKKIKEGKTVGDADKWTAAIASLKGLKVA